MTETALRRCHPRISGDAMIPPRSSPPRTHRYTLEDAALGCACRHGCAHRNRALARGSYADLSAVEATLVPRLQPNFLPCIGYN